MSERKPKTNAAWDALCAHTTTLFKTGRFGGRPEAFQEACKQHPKLAAEAIDPDGEFVIPRGSGQPTTAKQPEESPIVKAAEKLASQHKAGAPNPLIAAAEKLAAESRS